MKVFKPNVGDNLFEDFYPTGELKEVSYWRNDIPANGWSRTMYFLDGSIKVEECYSHNILIEQNIYDETGKRISHKLFNNRTKLLEDAPKQNIIPRPNVLTGCSHMGFFYNYLPEISRFIGADYKEEDLKNSFEEFKQKNKIYEEGEEPYLKGLSEDEACTHYFKLEGKEMSFRITFERHEGYFFFHLNTIDEKSFNEAKQFIHGIEKEFEERSEQIKKLHDL